MTQEYDPKEFWKKEGKRVMYGLDEPRYKDHYNWLIPYLGNLEFNSVLEIGAGDGRITDYMLDNFNISQYVCLDMSEDRKAMFLNNIPGFKGDYLLGDFNEISPIKVDLVLCVETLVHVKPENIKRFIQKMCIAAKKHVVFIEYVPKIPSTLAYYCFAHDYEAILSELGYHYNKRRVNDIQKLYHVEK